MTPKQRRLERMRAIEREWLVASIAAEDLGERLRANPSALAGERLQIADYRSFRDNLEPTGMRRGGCPLQGTGESPLRPIGLDWP
jgi:hypothetical protein